MNLQLVENILGVIKTSTDKAVIVKALLKLRTDLVKDKDGIVLFREAGGVAPMVRLLNKPHEKILEVVLSILGNSCTDEDSCKQAFECNCVPSLATILKSIPNPVIQCRACRLLGNLAKCDSAQLLATHCPAIAQAVCQIIVDTSDVQTRVMAFRACRFLLSTPQFLKHFLESNGFVTLLRILAAIMKNDAPPQEEQLPQDVRPQQVVGLKKTQHREKYFEEVARHLEGVRSDIFDHEVLKNSPRAASNLYVMPKEKAALDLACEILKCLLVMSELQISFPIWESLNRSSCTLTPIVFFTTAEDNKHRSVALKILSNFGKNRGAFYILSSSDAIVAACEMLVPANFVTSLSESEKRHCITIICALSPDACNRSKIRRSGALRRLIAMIRDTQSQTEISSILYLLNFFEYDNMSMELMLREGLIPVLIKELNAYLTGDDEYHKKRREERQQNSKKRKLPENPCESSICKFAKMREEPMIDCDSPSSSPRSYISPSSPCSSRSMSPVGSNAFKPEATACDDETYSPVCSDDEDEAPDTTPLASAAEPPTPTDNYSDIMKLLDIAGRTEAIEDNLSDKEDDDETSQDAPPAKLSQSGNLPSGSIEIIENLLFRATLLIDKRVELGKPETMKTLIKAVNLFGANNNFAGSLTNILLESQFFAQVINQGIPHQLFQLTKVPEMRKDGFAFLETLTCVGESNYGKAELARFLRCDNHAAQQHAAIAVAYIIKNQRLLYQFLNDGNALAVLLNTILSRKRDEFTVEAVEALTAMSQHTLGICMPQINTDNRNGLAEEYQEYKETQLADPEPVVCDMRFVVHDSKADVDTPPVVVPFSKQLLCDTSDVFNTMLTGDFREGKEGEIHLHSCTASGLRYFLDLVVRHSRKLRPRVPTVAQYHVLLETFEMARIYIIPVMEEFVLELLTGLLDASNCLSVLEWSIKNYHAELMEMAINYYLCSALSVDEKVELFHKAEYSTYSTEWFQMIFDAVLVRCRKGEERVSGILV